MEKYVEDVKQDQKVASDLLESMMRPTDPVKEELRRKAMKMHQFRLPNQKNLDFNFLDVRKIDGFPPEANTAFSPRKF